MLNRIVKKTEYQQVKSTITLAQMRGTNSFFYMATIVPNGTKISGQSSQIGKKYDPL